MTTIDIFRPRVRKGIAAIEAHERGATDRINLDTIDIYSHHYCPLAQSIGNGHFGAGRDKLGIAPSDDATAKYGFSLTDEETGWDNYKARYGLLREAWIAELTAHRTAKAALVAD